jgi:2-methylaconitate cis-trans-isomerase PrpF
MGLAERRKIKELTDTVLPEREKELLEITGSPIRYEIDWASLENDAEGLNFLDNCSCHRLNMALRVICADALGKEAVAEGLKLVKLANAATPAQMKIDFSSGVLEMHCAYAQRTDGMYSDNQIREVLMAKL